MPRLRDRTPGVNVTGRCGRLLMEKPRIDQHGAGILIGGHYFNEDDRRVEGLHGNRRGRPVPGEGRLFGDPLIYAVDRRRSELESGEEFVHCVRWAVTELLD